MDASGGLPEVPSTCPYCGVGCGVLLRPDGAGGLAVRGDPQHPANFGRLCSKGMALGETVGLGGRLRAPVVDGQEAGWDTALQLVADRFRDTIAEYGPDGAAFYVSGQLLTEDYYVANKLMKGFIGSANIDTNSRLCMASTVAGHKRAFGTDTVPGTYADLDGADLVVLVGSNLAWCHPVLHRRVQASGAKIVVIDPRRTASCDGADLHLAIAPGTDVALFNGLLAEIAATGAIDADFARHTNGLEEAVDAARRDDAARTGVSPEARAVFYNMWIGTRKVVTIFSQGVNQSTSGTDKVNAILNCHLATGRIGQPGMGPFSVTGQPNAMGGREVGGLANMLACHLDLENAQHRAAVRGFWQAPGIPDAPGHRAVDMFRAVGDGRIKALWIIHTNPAVTMPEADAVRAAIAGCDFVVVSDVTGATDTARLADVLLPATAWAEKDGTVTNSDRTISRQRAVLAPPHGARPDWAILSEVGQRMGWTSAFDYTQPAEIFREYAALSGVAARFGRDFDISGLQDLDDTSYRDLPPTRWPVSAAPKTAATDGRFFGDGRFFHTDGKARLVPLTARPLAAVPSDAYPFILNTGRIRDQWHTMTRTGLSARLSGHLAEPYLDIHPMDAKRLGLAAADLAQLASPHGTAILRTRITDTVAPGQLFAPMHWTGETAPTGRIDALIEAAVDPISGQPESKAAVVSVKRMQAAWYGFAVSASPIRPACDYWALATTTAGCRAELAGAQAPEDWEATARRLFDLPDATATTILDPARGTARIAFEDNGRMLAALFVSPTPVAVMRDYIASLPGTASPLPLTGRPPADVPDPGATLCACFGVGINTLITAIETQGLISVAAIGEALQAGTNCGSCRPELAALLAQTTLREAAE